MTIIDTASLSSVTGGFNPSQAIDAGNALAPKAAIAGGYLGAGVGATLGVIAGAPFAGVSAIPAGMTGAGVGGAAGSAIGGGVGWAVGAGYDAWQQHKQAKAKP